MSEVLLFEHNELAYERLIDALSRGNCATINHATGTGKSFIALKYLFEHRDKKYLYIAPTYQILDQLIVDATKLGINPEELNVDQLIYRSLLDMDMKELFKKYDGIIFDEYHKCGAKETFYKIKELKALLQETHSDKKFIGLTATPIRFLDNERNMTNEIFDGVVASNLTLSQAMCDELLPIPNYYISAGIITAEIEKLRKRVNDLPESGTKIKLLKELNSLHYSQFETNANSELFDKYLNQKQGKYIVFCKDIEALNFIHQHIHAWFKDINDDNIYEVHSEMSLEKRNQNLQAFNDVKKGFNILLCIDVLNEGVHVDDVDGVILNRRTSSPIIYFQQIGRALSFSGRKREIQIFDLVFNYGNHEAIYAVYDEFKEEIKRRITTNPSSKDKYEKMLQKFQIMDESREVLDKVREISNKLNGEGIITAKIENAILCIERYRKGNHIVDDILVETICDEEIIQAYYTLEKYHKYVTNAQFIKLQKLKFVMPPELIMSLEERKAMLGNYTSVHEKEKDEALIIMNEIHKFIEENQRTPKENSDDLIERNLFEMYKQCLLNLSAKQLAGLSTLVSSLDIELSNWEKIFFQIRPTNEEVNSLLHEAVTIVNSKKPLPKHIYQAINLLILRYDFKEQEKILKLLKASDKLYMMIKKRHKERQNEIINSINDEFFGEEAPKKDELVSHVDQLMQELDKSYVKIFVQRFNHRKKLFIKKSVNWRDETSLLAFSRRIISETPENITKMIKVIREDMTTIEKLEMVYEFMAAHDGRLPSQNVPNEKPLSDIINQAIAEGVFTDKILRLNMFKTSSDEITTSQDILKELIDSVKANTLIKFTIAKQVLFTKINNRPPCDISPDPSEVNLAIDYRNIVISNASDAVQLCVSKFLTKNTYFRNSLEKRREFMELQKKSGNLDVAAEIKSEKKSDSEIDT